MKTRLTVDFIDATLVKLMDAATRPSIFDLESLEQLLTCAYDVSAMSVAAPFTAVFDDVTVGVSSRPTSTVTGEWTPAGGIARSESQFRLSGLGSDAPRVDALWRGSIAAVHRLGGEPIETVETSSTDGKTISATLTFAPPQPVTTTAELLPVAIALLIRNPAAVSLAQMLADVRDARDQLATTGVEVPPQGLPHLRRRLVVALVVPSGWFDDTDWPGAQVGAAAAAARAQRRTAAGALLAEQEVGLVVTG